MQMPVVVGVILGIIFLVAFSEWFYHLVAGWGELVLDDVYYRYRILAVVLISMSTFGGTFYVMAIMNECPSEERSEGLLSKLDCSSYYAIKTSTDNIFSTKQGATE